MTDNVSSRSLGASHLNKLFNDFCKISADNTEGASSQQDDKLYRMLPLFCQTFNNISTNEFSEQFKNAELFCKHVSRLAVSQIRQRAASHNTVEASIYIASWLEDEDDWKGGAVLLRALLILALADPVFIDLMSEATLPSTLVSSLYLFIDLPVVPDDNIDKRNSMYNVFSRLLCQLVSRNCCIEELIKNKNVILLFTTLTSWCERWNYIWRVTASQAIATISRKSLTINLINHINKKNGIKQSLNNIQTNQRKSKPLDIVEMVMSILGFIKESVRISSILLDELRAIHGYNIIVDLVLACDARRSSDEFEDSGQAVRNLIMLLESLATCGSIPLKPAHPGNLHQIPSFTMPQPSGNGLTVCNAAAISALKSVWNRSTSERVCCCVVDAFLTLCRQEKANYFVLEPHGALISELVSQMPKRPMAIQPMIFELLDFVVIELLHVPSKEIVALGNVIKEYKDDTIALKCIDWLRSLLSFESSPCVKTFSVMLRELGILELIVGTLHNLHSIEKTTEFIDCSIIDNCWQLIKDLLTSEQDFTKSAENCLNACVFRDSGGVKLLSDLICNDMRRREALKIMRVLLQAYPTEEDLNVLMVCLQQNNSPTAVRLRIDILKCIYELLKEKHRVRTVFRKVNGFVYVTSILVSLEGCLERLNEFDDNDLIELFYCIFTTITLAMRFEPSNARFFATEIRYASLTEAIKLLGCFTTQVDIQGHVNQLDIKSISNRCLLYNEFFQNTDHNKYKNEIDCRFIWATHLLKYLRDVAYDDFEVFRIDEQSKRIVHAGAIVCMLHLVPAIDDVALQLTISELIRSCVSCDRNQQIMCESGLSHELLTHCARALEDETHILHLSLQSIFERLSAHSLSPRDLRLFLRLGSPLCCSSTSASHKTVPITRVKCLVSMTTPRGSTHITPPFVEFDLSAEGFACLYIPSLSPQGPLAQSVVGNSENKMVLGGVGAGERTFPPTNGLTFSTWFQVERFCTESSHPVRLLTLIRQSQQQTDECLKILLNKIRTQQRLELFIKTTSNQDAAHIELQDFTGQWCHLVVVLHKAGMLKNSNVVIYLDGQQVASRKLHYISPSVTQSFSLHAYVGTSISERQFTNVVWRQGSCHIIEDAFNSATVQQINRLGADYIGSLQELNVISEERISLGIHAHAMTLMTLAKIRKVYNRVDAKFIEKLLDLPNSNDNITPIRILHNSAGHLTGSARSLGSVLVGYVGVRTFVPRPVARTLLSVGGVGLLLGFVAQAKDVEELYASVKLLANVLRHVQAATFHMERENGFQILAMLLSAKHELLNGHILHLALGLVQSSLTAFEHLLCDLDVWRRAPFDLQRSLFERLRELISESNQHKGNGKLLKELVIKLLHRLCYDFSIPSTTITSMLDLLKLLLFHHPSSLRLVGQYIVNTLPGPFNNDNQQSNDCQEIRIRHLLLNLIMDLLKTEPLISQGNNTIREHLQKYLGFDWINLLFSPGLLAKTVIYGLRILIVVISHPPVWHRFKEANQLMNGWLQDLVDDNNSVERKIPKTETVANGWHILQELLPYHSNVPEIYYLVASLMLGSPPKYDLPSSVDMNLDNIYQYSLGYAVGFALPKNSPIRTDAFCLLLKILQAQMSMDDYQAGDLTHDIPIVVLQMLIFLYHNHSGFNKLLITTSSPTVLSALTSILFPITLLNNDNDDEPVRRQYIQSPERAATPGFTVLCSHPARKFVTDLLRTIILETLSLPQKNATPSVFDILIDNAIPETASRSQRCEFLTELVRSVSDHLANTSVLSDDQSPIPIALGGSYKDVCFNTFHIAARCVDILWLGFYIRSAFEIFDFVASLVLQCKRLSTGLQLDNIYKSLNRCVLYELSRPIYLEDENSQNQMVDSLQRVLANKSILLGPVNGDNESIVCLFYCVLELIVHPEVGVGAVDSRSKFFVASETNISELISCIRESAKKVWNELYHSKRRVVEEQNKLILSSNPLEAYNAIKDHSSKCWKSYLEREQKCVFSTINHRGNNLQNKLQFVQKVGSGVLKNLASKRQNSVSMAVAAATTSLTKEASVSSSHTEPITNFANILMQMAIVKDVLHWRARTYIYSTLNVAKSISDEWKLMECRLLHERGVWGPIEPCSLDKWMLDFTEGPCRQRKKLMANEHFYDQYPAPQQTDSTSSPSTPKIKTPSSFDTHFFLNSEQKRRRKISLLSESERKELQLNNIKATFNSSEKNQNEDENLKFVDLGANNATTTTDCGGDVDESEIRDINDDQSFLNLLEKNEKMQLTIRIARVEGLDAHEGIAVFGREHFYVIDGFTSTIGWRNIVDIDSLKEKKQFVPVVPKTTSSTKADELAPPPVRVCLKIAYDEIKEIHERRYLLQPNAVEVFSTDGRSILIVASKKNRLKLFAKLQMAATKQTDSASESVSGQRSGAKIEPGTISALMGERSVTQRWLLGEITNFEYLMCLNTLAGRSYNDLMQYPVFPWLLADYDSMELDFRNPATFRDFTKPMGAQSESRWLQFEKRFRDWDDTHSDTPPYHYGTHYSSAMIVASYLVRMEPFAQHLKRLQGGRFDLPDRMFHSIKEGWLSAAQNNMADVKELIPEFFYLPDFLLNDNKFDLGCKQSGVMVDDVLLPAWSKNDPREFIRIHRQALESDYVSANLHHWIDLIFGYKQNGDEAKEAKNVFHHLFYEGAVDIDKIDDPMERNAVTSFINNFGQIPRQLFKRPHPQRTSTTISRPLSEVIPGASYLTSNSSTWACQLLTVGQQFYYHLDNLLPSNVPIKHVKTGVGQIIPLDKGGILAVEQNKILLPPHFNRYLAWGYSDGSIRYGYYENEKALAIWEDVENGGGNIMCASSPISKILVTGGTSCVVNVWNLKTDVKDMKLILKKSLYGHMEPITCVCTSAAYNIIASGSRDRTVLLWDLNRLIFVRQLCNHAAPVAALCINEASGDLASCAGTYLYLWNVNGQQLASVNTATGRGQQICCVTISTAREWDKNNVIMTGNNDGVVRMWSLDYVQVPDDENNQVVVFNKNSSNCGNLASSMTRTTRMTRRNVLNSIGSQQLLEKTSTLPDFSSSDDNNIDNDIEENDNENNNDNNDDNNINNDNNDDDNNDKNDDGDCNRDNDSSMDGNDKNSDVENDENISETGVVASSDDENRSLSISADYVIIGCNNKNKKENNSGVGVGGVCKPNYVNCSSAAASTTTTTTTLKWQRQLIFRSKLTMHTAYERKDNQQPSGITCIAVSKDHKTVYVGDLRGRIHSWTIPNDVGKGPSDHWVKDEQIDSCTQCSLKFTLYERRHHCRCCGAIFCENCSKHRIEVPKLKIAKRVRVCDKCNETIIKENELECEELMDN